MSLVLVLVVVTLSACSSNSSPQRDDYVVYKPVTQCYDGIKYFVGKSHYEGTFFSSVKIDPKTLKPETCSTSN